ncbi:Transposase [Cyclonatronum proteinivorum]|uniref:Transposase n=1 Tax=Cyclonatronum proteinivorum TaxID=1457365 RepID=A0A345UHK5_9BACT|nr:transposase [Cyclonatronum proteinivorum]AXI99956.1 Transposase [Cyclonatronum proteinivorum]
MGPDISIDEVSLSRGELYTIVANKQAKGRKGSTIAIIQGTRVADLVSRLELLPLELRNQVRQVSMDMAANMKSAVQQVFAQASIVTDRFHVVRLVNECVQQARVKLRRQEMDTENRAIIQARADKKRYVGEELANGDTPKQLLARMRNTLNQPQSSWSLSQRIRMSIAFARYPHLETTYNHAMRLRSIYENTNKAIAAQHMRDWINDSHKYYKEEFATAANSVSNHMDTILNFFDHRATNANAESFNAKIKMFRAIQKGVRDVPFFLFRLEKLFA